MTAFFLAFAGGFALFRGIAHISKWLRNHHPVLREIEADWLMDGILFLSYSTAFIAFAIEHL